MANNTIYPYGTNGELPSSVGIINDLTTGGSDVALSAEMGKTLGTRTFLLEQQTASLTHNVQLLTEQLADSAFIGNRPDLIDIGEPISETVTVAFTLSNATVSNDKETCVLGASYHNKLVNDAGYVISSVTITMGGVDITNSAYNPKTREINIEEVTDDISIANTSAVNTNPNYRGLHMDAGSPTGEYIVMTNNDWLLTQTLPLTPGYAETITFKTGSTSLRVGKLILTDENGNYGDYYLDNAIPRTVTVGQTWAGLRQNCYLPKIENSLVTNDTDGVTLWDGELYNPNDDLTGLDYFDRFTNSRGDYVNVIVNHSQQLRYTSATSGDSQGYITSKLIELPSGTKSVEFSVGTIDSDCMIRFWDAEGSSNDYYAATAAPRTVSLLSKYRKLRIMTKTDYYEDSYVKVNGEIVWSGSDQISEE